MAKSPSWILLQAALEQSPNVRGYSIPARLGLDHRRQDRRHILALERAPAGDGPRLSLSSFVELLGGHLDGHVSSKRESRAR